MKTLRFIGLFLGLLVIASAGTPAADYIELAMKIEGIEGNEVFMEEAGWIRIQSFKRGLVDERNDHGVAIGVGKAVEDDKGMLPTMQDEAFGTILHSQ